MGKRDDGRADAYGRTTREIVTILQGVVDRPFNANELGHLDVLVERVEGLLGDQ